MQLKENCPRHKRLTRQAQALQCSHHSFTSLDPQCLHGTIQILFLVVQNLPKSMISSNCLQPINLASPCVRDVNKSRGFCSQSEAISITQHRGLKHKTAVVNESRKVRAGEGTPWQLRRNVHRKQPSPCPRAEGQTTQQEVALPALSHKLSTCYQLVSGETWFHEKKNVQERSKTDQHYPISSKWKSRKHRASTP